MDCPRLCLVSGHNTVLQLYTIQELSCHSAEPTLPHQAEDNLRENAIVTTILSKSHTYRSMQKKLKLEVLFNVKTWEVCWMVDIVIEDMERAGGAAICLR